MRRPAKHLPLYHNILGGFIQGTLTMKGKKEQRVKNESIRDTLQDLANYAILAIIELDEQADTKNSEGIE